MLPQIKFSNILGAVPMDYSGHFFTFGRAHKWSPEQSRGPDLVTAVSGVSRCGSHNNNNNNNNNNIMDADNGERGAGSTLQSSLGEE